MAGRNVVIIPRLSDLIKRDDAAVFLYFRPRLENVGDANYRIIRKVVLRIAFGVLATCVKQKELALPLSCLFLIQNDDDAGRGSVVEKIFRQIDNTLDKVLLHEPATHVLFLVGAGVARTARGSSSVEHNGGATLWFEAGENVLHPAPVRLAARKARALRKAFEFVSFLVLFFELGLVPHRIGYD